MFKFFKDKLINLKKFFKKDESSITSKIIYDFTLVYFIFISFLILISSFIFVFFFKFSELNFIFSLFSLIIGLIIFYFILRIFLKRIIEKIIIKRLSNIYNEMILIKNENFSNKRIKINGIDEIDKLAHTSNLIFDKYEKSIEVEKKHSLVDPLTLSFNRRALDLDFNSLCEEVTRKNIKFSMLLFDIDNFKKINDKYGHDIGDIVLKKLALVVKNSLRKYDTFYRIGGEEFIIIFKGIKISNLKEIILRLQKDITYHLKKIIPKIEQEITVSGGLVQSKDFDFNYDFKKILDNMYIGCDKLLYRAKNSGKNKILIK